jgi:hypothetical protein
MGWFSAMWWLWVSAILIHPFNCRWSRGQILKQAGGHYDKKKEGRTEKEERESRTEAEEDTER